MSARGTARLAVAIAQTQVGYHEHAHPRENTNKYSTAMGRPAEYWCADFLSWVFAKAQVPSKPNSASSATMLAQARHDGGDHGAKYGAVVRYTISHIGIVRDGRHDVIGGNTGPGHGATPAQLRSGGVVWAKDYPGEGLHVDGYGQPAYRDDDGSDLWPVMPYCRILHVDGVVGRIDGKQRGPDVRRVQYRLDMPAGDIDGAYGRETADLVERFQRKHHLKADGWVGPATWSKLF